MRHLTYLVSAVLLASYTSSALCAPTNSTSQKHMQVGKPFTLILQITPTGTPAKVDSLLAAGNKMLLGHGKAEFSWFIAKTPGKWVKLASGPAAIGVTAKVALSYDGQTLRSYYNNSLAASLAVSPIQFNGVVPIKLNNWLGEYNSAIAYAKVLNLNQIELASEPKGSDQTGTSSPSESTTEADPTLPSDTGNSIASTEISGSVKPTKPVEPKPVVDPTQPTDINPVGQQPNQPDGTVTPVEPVKPDESVTPVEPVKPDETVTPVEPVKPDETVTPVEPVKPDETVTPVEPVKPDETVTPVEPVKPDETVTPVEPVKPDESVTPVEPDNTAKPDKPVNPVAPEPLSPSAPADLNTSSVKQITVTVKVLAATATPEPDKILPYKHAIVTQEVEVLSVDKGSLLNIKKGDKIRIARWGILQGQKTDVSKTKVGDKFSLPLENYKDHQELERQYTVDTLPENYKLPYLLDMTE